MRNRGGELVDRRASGTLRPGAASLLIRGDRTVAVGAWQSPGAPGAAARVSKAPGLLTTPRGALGARPVSTSWGFQISAPDGHTLPFRRWTRLVPGGPRPSVDEWSTSRCVVKSASAGSGERGVQGDDVDSFGVGRRRLDDADALRAVASQAVLGHGVLAPSTLGTYLRSYSWGHARQFDKVAGELLGRAWAAGAGPGGGAVTIDMDSSILETYGLKKQGGAKFTYNHVRGHHPRVAVIAGTGDVVPSRLRGGNANTGRGAASFLTETFNRVRAAAATGPLTMRADSGFYSKKVVGSCRAADVRFSVTARQNPALRKAIAKIADDAWTAIPYFLDGADVAETSYLDAVTDVDN